MESLYSVELRHHKDHTDSPDVEDEDDQAGRKLHTGNDWLCVWLGAEHLCVNVSRQLRDCCTSEVHTVLSHSIQLLHATGNSDSIVHDLCHT